MSWSTQDLFAVDRESRSKWQPSQHIFVLAVKPPTKGLVMWRILRLVRQWHCQDNHVDFAVGQQVGQNHISEIFASPIRSKRDNPRLPSEFLAQLTLEVRRIDAC